MNRHSVDEPDDSLIDVSERFNPEADADVQCNADVEVVNAGECLEPVPS
jgi:hypothetical protein